MSDDRNIIRYLDGEMTKDERLDFEKKISENPDLAKEVETIRKLQRMAGNVLGQAEDPEQDLDPETREEIRQAVIDFKEGRQNALPDEVEYTIRDARQAYEQRKEKGGQPLDRPGSIGGISGPASTTDQRSNIRQIRLIWLSAAAIAILAAVISILIFRPFRSKPVQDLYATYYREYPVSSDIYDPFRADDDLLFAMKVYEAGDFERAAVLFEMLADSSESTAMPLFYAGHAYLHLNRTDRAIELFKELLTEVPPDLEPANRWYLALAYLRIGESEMAKEELLQIGAVDSPYRRVARRLLRDLP
jgi:tetratricopeptide (TPR) repeat protein